MICLFCFLCSHDVSYIRRAVIKKTLTPLFLLKGTLCYPKFSFPGKWNQWNPRMEILEDDVLFQRNDLEVPPLVFRGVSQEDTQNDAFWSQEILYFSQHQLDEKSILASIPSTSVTGQRRYFVVFNWVFPPVLVIIDHKHHHKSSLAMFYRKIPFNLWNYWRLEGKNKQPKLSIFCPHGRSFWLVSCPETLWRWKLAHKGVEMFFFGGGVFLDGEILGFV